MNKLKLFWKSRKTWSYAFSEWKILMFPHLYYTKFVCQNNLVDTEEDAWWLYQALNNYDNQFDDWGL